MSKIGQIQELVRNGLFYLTEHADDEAGIDGFDIYDIEYGVLNGKIRRTWPREGKHEVVGISLDGSSGFCVDVIPALVPALLGIGRESFFTGMTRREGCTHRNP